MREDAPCRLPGQPSGVDDAGVVQLVRDKQVALLHQGREQPLIGVPAAHVGQRGVRSEKRCNPLLELAVARKAPADESDARSARTVAPESVDARLHHLWMVCQPEIVV